MGESRLKMNLLYTSSPVKGHSVQCSWCLQCVSTRDMLQFGCVSGGLNRSQHSNKFPAASSHTEMTHTHTQYHESALRWYLIVLLATMKATWSVASISDKNKRHHRFPSMERRLCVIIIFKYFIYFHYLYTMNIHIHSWFSLITGCCSKGSTKLCSLDLKVGSFCYSKWFSSYFCPSFQLFHRDSWIHVIYMTDNLSNHKLLPRKSKAACLLFAVVWRKKENTMLEKIRRTACHCQTFCPAFRAPTERIKHQSCHLETMQLDVTFWKTKGRVPWSVWGKKGRGESGGAKTKTYIYQCDASSGLLLWVFSTRCLVCGTSVARAVLESLFVCEWILFSAAQPRLYGFIHTHAFIKLRLSPLCTKTWEWKFNCDLCEEWAQHYGLN